MTAVGTARGRSALVSLMLALALAGCGDKPSGGGGGGGGGGNVGGGGGGTPTQGPSKILYKDGLLDPALTAALWTSCGSSNPNLTASFAGQTVASFDLSCSTTDWQLAGVFTDWNPSFDLTGYDTIAFDIGAATSAGMSSVKLYLDNATVPLPTLTPGQLNHVTVPLSQLGSPGSFNQLGWYYQSTGAGPKLYVNAVVLTGPGRAAPTITTQPASQTRNVSQTVTFTVMATGVPAPTYQWQKNGAGLSGATSASYTTPPLVAGDDGATFRVVVTNSAGSVTSSAATLTVTNNPLAPSISAQPASQEVAVGQTATFTVQASGNPAPTYQWQRAGTAINGATSSSYTTPATVLADSGAPFRVVVTNSAGSVTSSTATLTVDPPAAFAVDVSRAPTSRASGPLAISPYIYGINPYAGDIDRATRWGLFRSGGDSFTTWNWIADYHNTGNDYCFGAYGGDGIAGDVAWVGTAATKGIAALVTTSLVDYVAANRKNETWPACNSAPGTNVNGISFAPSSWFVNNVQKKPSGALCLYPGPAGQPATGGACTLSADAATVCQDELVNYLKHWFVDGAGATVFVELDNEPNYWRGTHPEIWSSNNVYYADILNRDKAAAAAYRAVWPAAKIFGPVVAQDGIVYAHDYTRSDEFLDYYLPGMKGLLDVLDVHYYNSGSDTATCLQSPRAFWDPTYTVPNNQDGMDYIVTDRGNTAWTHRQLLPRLLDKIGAAGMSPVPGLAITEYDAGCEGAIAGGIAQADTLGVFGQYGVYAATAWLNARPTAQDGGPDPASDYAGVAFDLFRNYDGTGGVVGDLAVQATAPSVTSSSLYAFAHSGDPSKLELVALNKTTKSLPAHITVATSFGFTRTTLYHLIQAASGENVAVRSVGGTPPTVSCTNGACTLDVVLEPMSGTTIALR